MKLLRATLCLACFLPLAAAQGQQLPESETTIRKSVNLVLVDVIVSDKKGNTLNGLRPQDLTLYDEMVPQPIAHMSQDVIPLAIALVVDASSSMHVVFEPVRRALMRALPSLKPEDQVALFAFSGRTEFMSGLTRDTKRLSKLINRLSAMGMTNINDAIYDATQYLRYAAPEARRIIILVSDLGGSGEVTHDHMEVEAAFVEADVSLFVVVPRMMNDVQRKAVRGSSETPLIPVNAPNPPHVYVPDLAEGSGGWLMQGYSEQGLQAAVEVVFQTLKTRYTLGFYPQSGGEAGTSRRLVVHIANPRVEEVLPGAFVRYRRQYIVPRIETATAHKTLPQR